ncbi:MAG: sugar porter family MFS transporter, partial [Solimonas sp.]
MSAGARPSAVLGYTLVATLGGFLFGYDTAVISGAVVSIDRYFIAPLALGATARDVLSGLTIASALFGCIIGGAVAGRVADSAGRRGGLLLAALLFLLSGIGSAVPELGFGPIGSMGADALPHFIVYRVIGGIGIGLVSMLAPLYIAEIAPPAIRGRLVSYNQMAIVSGIVGVYFVNWAIALQGDEAWVDSVGWRWMLGSEVVPALLLALLLLKVPETPRYLAMKGRGPEALAVLRRLLDPAQAETVLGEIEASGAQHRAPLWSFGIAVVLIGLAVSVMQQLVGINAVLYYAPLIFRNMGMGSEAALLQTVAVGVVNAVFTLLAIRTVDRFGRRPLLIGGALVMAAS